MKKKISYYIVDDHQVLTESLHEMLKSEGFESAGSAMEGNTAVREILAFEPDVVLMDIDLPGLNGLDATCEILKVRPETSVVILTMHLEKVLVEKAVKSGVKGYLPKNVSKDVLIKAMREAAAGNRYFSTEVTEALVSGHRSSAIIPGADQLKLAEFLTSREQEVLKEISQGKTNRQIAEMLHLSPHTVDSHRKNIMQKTGVHNTAGLIRFAIKTGISI